MVFHVLNRANERVQLFQEPSDYRAFEAILREALEREPVSLLAYCVMPNHFHLVLTPQRDGAMSALMHWLGTTHARRLRRRLGNVGNGHVYQGKFKSFAVQDDAHLLSVCRYVERNPVAAGLVERAERWRWSSAGRRAGATAKREGLPLAPWPLPMPAGWLDLLNVPQTSAERESLRMSLRTGAPYGEPEWQRATAERLGIFDRRRRSQRERSAGRIVRSVQEPGCR
jgi:putative transposase